MNVPQPILHVPPERGVGTQVPVEKQVRVVKYVDDNLIIVKLNFGNVLINPGPPPPRGSRHCLLRMHIEASPAMQWQKGCRPTPRRPISSAYLTL